mmetsp:Transcript_35559/g.81496  ORF Transcript_35559/g.81496 Transcript_35559/m.81496 type:complete len:335 (-) Transcript_35559:137-1141(-)
MAVQPTATDWQPRSHEHPPRGQRQAGAERGRDASRRDDGTTNWMSGAYAAKLSHGMSEVSTRSSSNGRRSGFGEAHPRSGISRSSTGEMDAVAGGLPSVEGSRPSSTGARSRAGSRTRGSRAESPGPGRHHYGNGSSSFHRRASRRDDSSQDDDSLLPPPPPVSESKAATPFYYEPLPYEASSLRLDDWAAPSIAAASSSTSAAVLETTAYTPASSVLCGMPSNKATSTRVEDMRCERCHEGSASYFDFNCPECGALLCYRCIEDFRYIQKGFRCPRCGDMKASQEALVKKLKMLDTMQTARRFLGNLSRSISSIFLPQQEDEEEDADNMANKG